MNGAKRNARRHRLGCGSHHLGLRTPGDFDGVIGTVQRESIDGLVVFVDSLTNTLQSRILDLAMRSRLPLITEFRDWTDSDGLPTYGPSSISRSARVADYVDRIVKGANPAEMPIEQPTGFDFIINLKSALAPGVTIPPALLSQTTEIIQ
jgi:putative tryptophan/tyrosine transport system substrate-binding protein